VIGLDGLRVIDASNLLRLIAENCSRVFNLLRMSSPATAGCWRTQTGPRTDA
jgi:hypothetical protein